MRIDVDFDFLTETPEGGDADCDSPTLRRYHRELWSKPLPSGQQFDLTEGGSAGSFHLRHESELGAFVLSSDAITNLLVGKAHGVISQIPQEQLPEDLGYRIASAILFPKHQIDGKWSINQERGMNHLIADRFDLTLDCIRRHYLGQHSPLADVLRRYDAFFSLFDSFSGYIDFWLLQDLVDDDGNVRYLTEDGFGSPPVPTDAAAYLQYGERTNAFIKARSARIASYAEAHG